MYRALYDDPFAAIDSVRASELDNSCLQVTMVFSLWFFCDVDSVKLVRYHSVADGCKKDSDRAVSDLVAL